ncbi:hypothetical protein DFJ74DRAFT_708612 [Hyaloraphidium curvatum]|nr:hypothetical protein DFJ74DRAFT_708612 [Hyaloraphidium curvatum]
MKGHAAEVEALRSALDALERRLAHPKRLDINALQEEYRGEIAELRARWEADGLAKLDQLRRMDAEAAMARWARERDELRRQHDAELAEATMRVKQQCTQAYSSAVSKLKTEYAKLEQVLSGRFQDEIRRRHALWEEEKSELRRNHEMELENALSRARRDPSGELKRRIRYLEDMLAESEGTARGLKDALATILRNVKDKYLTTLRSMRDDVAASKQRSLDKLEAEWQRRKERLDAEWGERMAQLRASYEQGREPLRR